jgi:quercetin dioxygenase-like cupin family protein
MADEIRLGGVTVRFLVEAEELGGAAAVFEFSVGAHARVPVPHSHDAYEETIYGVEGVLTWTVGGETRDLAPGEALTIPRGVVHGFANDGDVDTKSLAIVTPGVLGPDYFREIAGVIDAAVVAGRPPEPAEIGAVMRRHGLTPAPPSG